VSDADAREARALISSPR